MLDMNEFNRQQQEEAVSEQHQNRLQQMETLACAYDGDYDPHQQQEWSTDQIKAFLEDCQACCYWPLMTKIAVQHLSQLSTEELGLAANAALQMGCLRLVKSFVRRGLLIEPESEYLLQIAQGLGDWMRFAHQYQFSEPYPANEEGLYLQLLGHHHVDSFMSVYDQQTASLCCLPVFVDEWDWHQWLDDQYELGDQLTFVVMHPDLGLVGSVSLVLHDSTGFFYYWIGRDFRGHCFGPKAVDLLLDIAYQRYGLERCYAKVFESNEGSRRGLQKLGFEELPIRAAEPYEDEIYYCLGDTTDLDALTEDMYSFYRKIKCWKPFTRPLAMAPSMTTDSKPAYSGHQGA